jgi:cysteine desulfuration protein SufE
MAISGVTLEELTESFELFDDWEDKYRYVIDLGRKLPAYPEEYRIDAFKVRGCVSQVWVHPRINNGRFDFDGDSDAHIVKGLVAIMMLIYSEKTPGEVIEIDAREILNSLGLAEHLSPMRTNGLFSMVAKIREIARSAS